MKKLMVVIVSIVIGLFIVLSASAEELGNGTATSKTAIAFPKNQHTMNIDLETGQISIDDNPIEKLSDPEIREAMKEIAKSMSQNSNSLIEQYDRQTVYLLEELQKCQEKCKTLTE